MVRTVPLSIIRSFSLYTQQTLHGSDSSSVHHQEFFTVHTANSTCFGQFLCPSSEFFTVHTANSTCFGQFLCPSSGVFHCTHSKLYMFRTVSLSIIRSFSLYTQQTLHVSDSSSVHHQEFFTVHTANYMFRTVPLSIIRSFSLYTQHILHVSDSSSVHHQEFFTVHTAMVYVIQVCWQLATRIRTELWEISASSWFYYKNLSRCTVTWTSDSELCLLPT